MANTQKTAIPLSQLHPVPPPPQETAVTGLDREGPATDNTKPYPAAPGAWKMAGRKIEQYKVGKAVLGSIRSGIDKAKKASTPMSQQTGGTNATTGAVPEERSAPSSTGNTRAKFPAVPAAAKEIKDTIAAINNRSPAVPMRKPQGWEQAATTGHPPPPVLSAAFFDVYDDVEQTIAELQLAPDNFSQARHRRTVTQGQFQKLEKEFEHVMAFIKEQETRIDLVSNHWFYGTTALQPQLWMRGGCQGKIERAQAKLCDAHTQTLPQLAEQIKSTAERLQLLRFEEEMARSRFSLHEKAVSERNAMRQRAFLEHPSPRLRELNVEKRALELDLKKQRIDLTQVEGVVSALGEIRRSYDRALDGLRKARQCLENLERMNRNPYQPKKPSMHDLLAKSHGNLSRTERLSACGEKTITVREAFAPEDVFVLNRQGRIISTNFPCPGGCGFLVTWHDTHCCGSCERQSGSHGSRCARKRVESAGSDALKKRERMKNEEVEFARKRKEEEEACNGFFVSAVKEAQEAENRIQKALDDIPGSVRQRHAGILSRVVRAQTQWYRENNPRSRIAPLVVSDARAVRIDEEMEAVTNYDRVLLGLLDPVKMLRDAVSEDTRVAEEAVRGVGLEIGIEQDSLFAALRCRAHASRPTAPMADDNFCSGSHSDRRAS